jgi:pyrroloquinoline quinone (PQQ) biosynthesis protein C
MDRHPRVMELTQLRQRIRSAWAATADIRLEGVADALASSSDLAHRAYVDDERAARWRAESTLYLLNADTSFAPPTDPMAAVVWSTLMHAKLAALRRRFLGDQAARADVSVEEMDSLLEAAVAKWGAFEHPLLDDLERCDSIAAYRVWAKNWFGSCQGFALQLASLFQRTTGEAKRTVLANLSDELDCAGNHDDLRERFFHSLGLRHSYEAVLEDEDWVLESTELLNFRTGLCNLSDPTPALGCFYSIEVNWVPECKRHHGLNKRRGMDDLTLQYWATHAFADERHSDEWLQAIKAVCRSGRQRAQVVEGAIIQLRLRWEMYDAIRARIARAGLAD